MTQAALSPRVPPGTLLLALGQAVNLTVAVLMVTVAALAGGQLAPGPAWATVPYGIQFAAVLACTYPVSLLMRRVGRRPVFLGSAGALVLAGATGLAALEGRHFSGLVLAHVLVGAYVACANFFRFAAVDGLAERERSQALSLVVAGGVLAALVGPPLANALRQVPGFTDFAWVYGSLMALGATQLVLMAIWRPRGPGALAASRHALARSDSSAAASTREGRVPPPAPGTQLPLEVRPKVALAIASAAGGYLVMNLLMVQASLLLKDICTFDMASRAIQFHVLAMFVPSFFTGRLITYLGLRTVISAGLGLLAAAAAAGVALSPGYAASVGGLVLLGIGWNLSYVGGSALLAQAVPEGARHRWQGLHETVTAACATAGAFLPAPLLTHAGWSATNAVAFAFALAGLLTCQRVLAAPASGGPQHA